MLQVATYLRMNGKKSFQIPPYGVGNGVGRTVGFGVGVIVGRGVAVGVTMGALPHDG